MLTDWKFLSLSGVILLLFSMMGFVVVPTWPQYFQTPEQRYAYLIESIWCPI